MTVLTDDIIRRPISALLNSRRQVWEDGGSEGAGLVKSMEALEAALIPATLLKGEILPEKPDFDGMLVSDLRSILEAVEKEWWIPSPYLTPEIRKKAAERSIRLRPDDYWCVDTASFVLSTFSDALVYLSRKKILDASRLDLKRIREVLIRTAMWLQDNACEVESGETNGVLWGWGNRLTSLPGVYFTYSAAVGIAAFLNEEVTGKHGVLGPVEPNLAEELKRELLAAASWLQASIVINPDHRFAELDTRPLAGTSTISDGRVYLPYVLMTFEAASQVGSFQVDQKVLGDVAKSLYTMVESREYFEVFNGQRYVHNVQTRVGDVEYEDRTITYLATAGLAWAYKMLRGTEHGNAIKNAVSVLVQDILLQRHPETGLWASTKFEIYRTQRAIEALSYVLVNVGEDAIPSIGAPRVDRLRQALRMALVQEDVIDFLARRLDKEFPEDRLAPGPSHPERKRSREEKK